MSLALPWQSPQPLRAVVFDMDGVLVDSEPLWREAEVRVFRALGVPLTHEQCRETTGVRVDGVVRHWRARHPWRDDVTNAQVEADIIAGVVALIRAEATPMAGVTEALAANEFSGQVYSIRVDGLPQIDGVANARVHPHASSGRHDVSGVAS